MFSRTLRLLEGVSGNPLVGIKSLQSIIYLKFDENWMPDQLIVTNLSTLYASLDTKTHEDTLKTGN